MYTMCHFVTDRQADRLIATEVSHTKRGAAKNGFWKIGFWSLF